MKKRTKGEINRLGVRIRESDNITDVMLTDLQEFRISHKEAMSAAFNALCAITKSMQRTSIVTYRLKRFESIIGKLKRYPSMELSRMWDIAGCRCIVRNDREVYKLKELIKGKLEIRKEYDYIKEPQKEGYKSLHLFVSLPGDNKVIEVQIRNIVDHNWATLVEISDFLFDAKLKEYGENKDLLRFHYLLSKVKELNVNDKYEIAKTIKKYKYFERLSEVFARNYLQVRKQWFEIENNREHKFFIIETAKLEVPKIYPFTVFNDAEEKYFELYKNSPNANIILTHLSTPNYKSISIAYSNYILTFHTFLHECHGILNSLIVEALCRKEYMAFYTSYKLYLGLVYNHLRNLHKELQEIKNTVQFDKSKKSKNYKKEKEWINDIVKEANKSREHSMKLRSSIRKNLPQDFLSKQIYSRIENHIAKRFRRKIKKVFDDKV